MLGKIIGLNTHNLNILLKIGFTLNSKLQQKAERKSHSQKIKLKTAWNTDNDFKKRYVRHFYDTQPLKRD